MLLDLHDSVVFAGKGGGGSTLLNKIMIATSTPKNIQESNMGPRRITLPRLLIFQFSLHIVIYLDSSPGMCHTPLEKLPTPNLILDKFSPQHSWLLSERPNILGDLVSTTKRWISKGPWPLRDVQLNASGLCHKVLTNLTSDWDVPVNIQKQESNQNEIPKDLLMFKIWCL